MSAKGWMLLVLLGVLWGIPYLLIRIALDVYSPAMIVFGRAVIGAAILMPFAIKRGAFLSGFKRPFWLLAYTLVEICGPWILIGYAELHVPSATAGLLIALTPIFATVIGAAGAAADMSARKIAGLALGLAGVACLLGFDVAHPHWLAYGALCLSALGYAIGPMIVARKLSDGNPLGVVVASLIIASLLYLPVVPAYWPQAFTLAATGSVIALAALSTALAFMLLFALISEVGPIRATMIAYVNPAVAVLLGALVLSEPVSAATIAGFLLIVTGTYFATHAGQKSGAQVASDARAAREGGAGDIVPGVGRESSSNA